LTPPPRPGPELLRRALLGLATALIVARALVPSEDVGLLDSGSNPLGLAVPLLWLCGLVTWAAWRIWAGRSEWYGGLIEACLLGVVLFGFLGTTLASYRRPAEIVAWEWAGLLAAFFLVRQIARTAAEQRGLLAVLLATGVSLAVQSLYQRAQRALPDRGREPIPGLTADELPRLRCELLAQLGNTQLGNTPQEPFPAGLSLGAVALMTSDRDPTVFERVAARNNVRPETEEPVLPLALRPRPPRPPTATFDSVTHLAGCLALLLPALTGCVLAAWLGGAPRWQLGVALGCALLTALALWLTQVRSAILPCLLVGAAASVLAWRHYSSRATGPGHPSPRTLILLALAGPAALVLLAFLLVSRPGPGFRDLGRDWSAAWAMLQDHFWLGVGPGNYGRHYPQYSTPAAPSVRQPANFALEVWATFGLPALVLLGMALTMFFRRTLTFVPRSSDEMTPVEDRDDGRTRWEFYEGGMIGLLIGFLFRALPGEADTVIPEALAAGVRAVVWFATFALLHGIRWTGATRILACTAGVAVLLMHLAVADGISVPGVAQPLWLLAALALNGLPESPLPTRERLLGYVVPLALAAAAALLCVFQIFEPVTSARAANRAALKRGQWYLDMRSGVSESQPDNKVEIITNRVVVLKDIITRLEEAVTNDPADARHWTDLADWYGILYETALPTNEQYWKRGIDYAQTAQKKDPLGEAGYLAESRLHELGASRAPTLADRIKEAESVPRPLLKIINRRPNDALLHYRLAVALVGAREPTLGKVHAVRSLDLDAAAPPAGRPLSNAQRQQAERFVKPSP